MFYYNLFLSELLSCGFVRWYSDQSSLFRHRKAKLNQGTLIACELSLQTPPPTHRISWVCGDDMSRTGLSSLPVCPGLSCPAAPHFPLLFLPCFFRRGQGQGRTVGHSAKQSSGILVATTGYMWPFLQQHLPLASFFSMCGTGQALHHIVQYVHRPAHEGYMHLVHGLWTWQKAWVQPLWFP